MTHDFDEDLRQALRRHAATTPNLPDLSRAAIGHARTIRRRRRTGGLVAALALVVVAVPLGLQAGDAVDRGQPPVTDRTSPTQTVPTPRQTQTTLDLDQLPAGPAPAVPYLDGTTLVHDGQELDLGGPPENFQAALGADGVVYHTSRPEGRPSELERFSPTDGELSSLGTADSGPWASGDRRYVLWVLQERGSRALTALDTETGEEHSLPVGGDAVVYPLGVVDDTAYLWLNERVETWPLGETDSSVDESLQEAFAFSPDATLRDDDLPGETETSSCSSVVEQSTGAQLWRSCDHTVGGFTSDNQYAWGYSSDRVSESRGYNVVLDARSGEELLRIDTGRGGVILDNRLESDDTLLVLYAERGEVAIVRCTISSGTCELATAPMPGSDGSVALPFPYLLDEVAGTS